MQSFACRACLALLTFFLAGLPPGLAHSDHPLGKELLEWQPDPHVSRVLTMNFDFHGGDAFVSWRRPGRVVERGDRRCVVGPYFFFDVDDGFAFNIDETVTLELLFDRQLTDGFNLSYDHAIRPTAKQVRLEPGKDARWARVTTKS